MGEREKYSGGARRQIARDLADIFGDKGTLRRVRILPSYLPLLPFGRLFLLPSPLLSSPSLSFPPWSPSSVSLFLVKEPASSSRVLCCAESSEAERTDVRRRNFLPYPARLPSARFRPRRFVSRSPLPTNLLRFPLPLPLSLSLCITPELRSNDDRPVCNVETRPRCSANRQGFAKIRIRARWNCGKFPSVTRK